MRDLCWLVEVEETVEDSGEEFVENPELVLIYDLDLAQYLLP